MNKEDHADQFTEIVTAYFLAQRIKPVDKAKTKVEMHAYEDYNARLRALHGMMVHAMKAKQTTDLAHVESLRGLIDQFQKLYAHKHKRRRELYQSGRGGAQSGVGRSNRPLPERAPRHHVPRHHRSRGGDGGHDDERRDRARTTERGAPPPDA
jgi:hypothetical protein